MNIYDSDEIIYQINPPIKKISNYKLKTWTDTIEGYIYEAKNLLYCLITNKKLLGMKYSWFVTINFHRPMTVKGLKKFYNDNWIKICKKLKDKGLIAFWIIEVTKKNQIHFHLIVLSNHTKNELDQMIEKCLPERKAVNGWHKKIEAIKKNDYRLIAYICKAKISGKTMNERQVEDLHRDKRLLFKKNLGIKKHGFIGKFWAKPVKDILKEQREKEARIAYGMGDKDIMCLRDHIYEGILGKNYNKLIKTKTLSEKPLAYDSWINITRLLAIKHDCPVQRNWIENLKAEEDFYFQDAEKKYGHLKNHRISEGLQDKDIVIFAHYLYKYYFNNAYNFSKKRYYTLEDIQESVAYNHKSPVFTEWISRVKLEEPEYFEKNPLDCLQGI